MQERRFMQLDVFAEHGYAGNALAVVIDGEGISDDAMLRFARWTNLSETTFLLPPTPAATAHGADYRVRIFTPAGELAFAGHPTLGSCHAWLASGGQPKRADVVVQECAKGLITVEHQANSLAFVAPSLQRSDVPADLLQQVLHALQLDASQLQAAQWLDNGSRWMGLLMRDVAHLAHAQPNGAALRQLGVKAGLCALHPTTGNDESVLEVRAITLTAHGIAEDPATGSLNASLALWLTAEQHLQLPYRVQQGAAIGRAGRMRLYAGDNSEVWVQGQVHRAIQGTVHL